VRFDKNHSPPKIRRFHRRINYIRKKAVEQERKRKRWAVYRANKNFIENHWKKHVRKEIRQLRKSFGNYIYIEAPHILSLTKNPEEVSLFISEIRSCFENKKPIYVRLRDVIEVGYDAITVLLSVVVRFKSKGIGLNGDLPEHKPSCQLIKESGFFEYIYKKRFKEKQKYELKKSHIVTHANKSVMADLGAALITQAALTVWGENRRCPGVQRTLVELMQNTTNHATVGKEGDKHWWLSIHHQPTEKRVIFSFVDYGVGVFVSLGKKPQGNKFFNAINRLGERFFFGNNADVLKLIHHGELHKTFSGKAFRGKGLPGIYETFAENRISRLSMLTNDVFYDSEHDHYKILKNSFEGTFIRWELCPSNHSLPPI